MKDQQISLEQTVFLRSAVERREAEKKGKLEYLTVTPEGMASYPLLGSTARALGKGWNVGVVAGENTIADYLTLQEMLTDPGQMRVVEERDVLSLNGNGERVLILDSISDRTGKLLRDRMLGKAHILTAGTQNHVTDDYDLVSVVHEVNYGQRGVTAFTGEGKGKTSSALGMAMHNAIQNGENVAIVQWYKEKWDPNIKGQFPIHEHFFPALLKDSNKIQFFPMGVGFFGSPNLDRVPNQSEQREYALAGLAKAEQVLQSGDYGIVVLDEMIDPVEEISGFPNLLELEEVRKVLVMGQAYPVPVIVTGRRVTDAWSDLIEMSHVIENKWHPYSDTRYGREKQQFAQLGIDY